MKDREFLYTHIYNKIIMFFSYPSKIRNKINLRFEFEALITILSI